MHDNLPVYYVMADSGELGRDSFLKLQGYHELICRILEYDMSACNSSLSDTLAAGYAWAMISLSIQVENPVHSCEKLSAQTWLSENEYPYQRREIQIFSSSEKQVLSASLFMVPLNTSTHSLQPEASLLCRHFPVLNEFSVNWALPKLKTIITENYSHIDTRTVRPSDIDALGHLNNCIYGGYVYDLSAELGRSYTSLPFRYTMHFIRQCTLGEKLNINAYLKNNEMHVLGLGDSDGKKRFCSILAKL